MRDDEITAHALAAGRGDADATTAFVRATQADVWRYVAYLVDREHADDLTQETFLRALRGLRTYRGDVPARVWLLSIARRAVVDHFRKQGRTPTVAASLDADTTVADRIAPATPDPANAVSLQTLVAGLDPDRRAAFVLTQINGLSYDEAAAACGVPIGTIRSRVARAREDLLAAMQSDSPAAPAAKPARRLRRSR
ncbi:sigma-70 family RNA polymerase sigma factor [Sporichthya polymorpha]|uniref:sigma-70 family RNA polymerase sigma factor n=1 Tax=Sporichthya polymorpha TaxID=35751 RepID=UPI0003769D21|nr:sigma-70 family RNA polymerase sigma factor [Sporichthya polymorpha]